MILDLSGKIWWFSEDFYFLENFEMWPTPHPPSDNNRACSQLSTGPQYPIKGPTIRALIGKSRATVNFARIKMYAHRQEPKIRPQLARKVRLIGEGV